MKFRAIVLLVLTLTAAVGFSETFMIVAREIRDGEELQRPFASQEGMIEGMFDLGYVSFDTGLYAPAVDWETLDFREPLDIARQGLARYLLAAEAHSITEPGNQADPESVASTGSREPGKLQEPALKIRVTVRFHVFDVHSSLCLGEGELVMDNEGADEAVLTYFEFLHSAGREVAARSIGLVEAYGGQQHLREEDF
ncbi:MAG: hypothetical protein JXB06_02945 [Spirochaetales bacterium]|nr:hypothetical protein [Spirochaetales bacterium]